MDPTLIYSAFDRQPERIKRFQ